MDFSYLQHPTDKIVFDTLVRLVRKVPWGPTRDQLEWQVGDMRARCQATHDEWLEAFRRGVALSPEEQEQRDQNKTTTSELAWSSELYLIAAEARFPRDGDDVVANFADYLVEDIRLFQARGYQSHSPSLRDISEAVSGVVEEMGVTLADLPLPPTIEELIDQGADRPEHVGEGRWENAIQAYYHRMTLENTPAEFIYGDGYDDDDFDAYDHEDDDESDELERDQSPSL